MASFWALGIQFKCYKYRCPGVVECNDEDQSIYSCPQHRSIYPLSHLTHACSHQESGINVLSHSCRHSPVPTSWEWRNGWGGKQRSWRRSYGSFAVAVAHHDIVSYLDEASVTDLSLEVWESGELLCRDLILGDGPFPESVSFVMEN